MNRPTNHSLNAKPVKARHCSMLAGTALSLSLATSVQAAGITPNTVQSGTIRDAGDVLQYAIPLAGLGMTAYHRDLEGLKQFGASALTTIVTTQGLKETALKLRPDGNSTNSFPSGHTAASFLGATYLYKRYGIEYGIPAYAAAGFVAYSRVWADAHHIDDVVGGASFATLSTLYWTTPHASNLHITPFQSGDARGVSLQLPLGSDNQPSPELESGPTDYRFSFLFGPAKLVDNRAGDANEVDFNLSSFDGLNNPTTTSLVRWDYLAVPQQRFSVWFQPFEARDTGTLNQPTNFADQSFSNNVGSVYRSLNLGLEWRYRWQQQSPLITELGGGIAIEQLTVGLQDGTDLSSYFEKQEYGWMPYLSTLLGYRFNADWQLELEAQYGHWDSSRTWQLVPSINWRFQPRWWVGLSHSTLVREFDGSKLYNKTRYDTYAIRFDYEF